MEVQGESCFDWLDPVNLRPETRDRVDDEYETKDNEDDDRGGSNDGDVDVDVDCDDEGDQWT